MEIQQVILTIRKLTQKTTDRGCTEAEAMSAMAMIDKLLRTYNLSMDRVYLGETSCVTKTVDTNTKNRCPIDNCLVAIAYFCDCKVWFSKGAECSSYKFFGLEPDTEMAAYLYIMIKGAVEVELNKFKLSPLYQAASGHRRRHVTSFQYGMVNRISARLNDLANERNRSQMQESANGTNLIVVKNHKIESEFEQLNLGLRKKTSLVRFGDYGSFMAGSRAGDDVNLNRPLNNQGSLLALGHG
jgi:hypothetical protein